MSLTDNALTDELTCGIADYDDYGPAAIVDAEQHKSGPTIQSIVKQMQANDVHCGKAVKVEGE